MNLEEDWPEKILNENNYKLRLKLALKKLPQKNKTKKKEKNSKKLFKLLVPFYFYFKLSRFVNVFVLEVI